MTGSSRHYQTSASENRSSTGYTITCLTSPESRPGRRGVQPSQCHLWGTTGLNPRSPAVQHSHELDIQTALVPKCQLNPICGRCSSVQACRHRRGHQSAAAGCRLDPQVDVLPRTHRQPIQNSTFTYHQIQKCPAHPHLNRWPSNHPKHFSEVPRCYFIF